MKIIRMMKFTWNEPVQNDCENKIQHHNGKDTTQHNQDIGCILSPQKQPWQENEIIGIIECYEGQYKK